MKNTFLKTLAISLFLLALPMTQLAQAVVESPDANTTHNAQIKDYENGFLFNVFEIENVEERVQLASALATSDVWLCDPTDNPGELFIRPNSHYADAQTHADFDYFRTILKEEYKELASLPKDAFIEIFNSWAHNLSVDYYNFLISDYIGDRANHCMNAEPFCTTDVYNFPAINSGVSWSGPNYGCLGSSPMSKQSFWYYMRIGVAGNITIKIQASFDVDFALWGPFNNQIDPCPTSSGQAGLLTANCSNCPNNTSNPNFYPSGNLHDCSFDGNSYEYAHIVNGQVGQFYILLITNYAGSSGNITFQKYAGNGETDCGILPPLVQNDGPYCIGETIHLQGNAQSGATYSWSGPGGWTATGQSVTRPNCTMAMAGTYTCTITVGNQSNSANTSVVVYANPIANFTATEGCYGEPTQFTSTSTTNPAGQPITSYLWNFGDGQTSTQQNPTHQFSTVGNHNVSLTVKCGNSDSHCSDTKQKTVTTYAQPVANFTATAACLGEPTQFTSTSTTNPTGQQITNYLWDFGDGQTSTQQNPSHTYAAIGSYNVSLTVGVGNNTCTDTKSGTEVVVYAQPIADFTATTVCRGEPTLFTNTSSTNPVGQAITSYLWDFGDGQSSTQESPSHQYAEAGDYEVTLTISCGNNTCSNSKTMNVTVHPFPVANAGEDLEIDYGLTAQLNGSGGDGDFIFQWEPADLVVNPHAAQTQTVALTESQTFELTVTNQQGDCVDNDQVNVLVRGAAMTATASASPTSICHGETTSQLKALAVGGTGNYTYQWAPTMGLSDPVVSNPIANPETTTTYTCTIFDGQTTKQVTATVTVNYPDYSEEETQYICPGEDYPFYGQTCSEPGDYYHYTTTTQGCEKIITLHLNQYPSYEHAHTTTATLCPGESFPFHGHNYTTPGMHSETLQTIHGCDSVVWLNLSFYTPNDTTIVDPTTCASQTYNFHGMLYDQDGDIAYFDTIDEHGCLKVEKLILSVGPYQIPEKERPRVCYDSNETKSYYWDKTGRTYYQDIETDTILPDPNGGCDIKYRLDLKFHPEFYNYDSVTECNQYTWDVTGETFYNSGHIVREYPIGGGNEFRCDSTYVLDLTINYSNTSDSIVLNQCDQFIWQFGWNGEADTLREQNDYTKTINTALGCDSTVTLHLQMDYSPAFARVEGNHWVIGGSEFQYTREKYWIKTNPKSTHTTDWALFDKNGQPFDRWDIDPFDNGDKCYLYIYTYERDSIELRVHTQSTGDCNCGDYTKSTWIHCSSYDVQEIIQHWNIDIYPNPNDGNMTLTLENMSGDVTVKVFDITGALVDLFHVYNGYETQSHTYNSNKLAPGVYFFSFSNREGSTTKKVIVY